MGDIYLNAGTLTGSFSWTNTTLFSTGAVPVAGDNVYLVASGTGFSLDSGFNGALLASLNAYSTFKGSFGGIGTNTANAPATVTNVGLPAPDGSGGPGPTRWKQNNGTAAGTWNLYASLSSNGDSPQTPITLSGSNAANTINLMGGVAGVGVLTPNEAVQFPTIRANNGTLYVGSGALVSTIQNNGGNLTVAAGGWTGTNAAGTLTTRGTFAVNALTCVGGTIHLNHRAASGTSVGTLNVFGADADYSGNPAPATNGATVLRSGSLVQFLPGQVNPGTVTVDTNGNETFTAGNS
jgi:hypothetical protein